MIRSSKDAMKNLEKRNNKMISETIPVLYHYCWSQGMTENEVHIRTYSFMNDGHKHTTIIIEYMK